MEGGAPDGTTLLKDDWKVELGAPEAKELVEEGETER